ncbi:hypothetical protein ABW21_db0201936 [Orbilia brochopaga]|nr:hypothetical protein ABW21_db0201936 [Drechslerella brochopaga]
MAPDSIADHNSLRAAYIDDMDGFFAARLPGITALPAHYVSPDWLEKVELAETQSLDEHGFADIKEHAQGMSPQDHACIQDLLKRKQTRKLLIHGGCLVTQDFLNGLLSEGVTYAIKEAERAWATAVDTTVPVSLSSPLPWRELLNVFTVSHDKVPQSALESIAQTAASKTSARYVERVNELRDAANGASKANFMDRVYARFQINMAAVTEIQDAGLQEKLAQDLLTHYHKLILDGLPRLLDRVADSAGRRRNERLEDAARSIAETCAPAEPAGWLNALRSLQTELQGVAQIIGADEPSDEILEAKKSEMQAELKASLAKTTDASLMMLVVLILLHSENGAGVLRASGKYAPKLLKTLRPKVTETDFEFLSGIKNAVIARAPLTEQDIEKLRSLG